MSHLLSSSPSVRTVTFEVTEDHISDILNTINRFEDNPFTLEEVLSNEKLLDYIVSEIANDTPLSLYDPFEVWNSDYWSDIHKYR